MVPTAAKLTDRKQTGGGQGLQGEGGWRAAAEQVEIFSMEDDKVMELDGETM